MKKTLSFLIILMLTLTYMPNFKAASPVSGAVKEYKSALSAQSKAKSAYTKAKAEYNKAAVDFNKGSYGFFSWVASNRSGWEAEDAREAMNVIDKTSYKKYTKLGDKNDATCLDNMKRCIDLFPTLVNKRKNDENFKGRPTATFRHVYMARSQVNANASAITDDHMRGDTGYPTEETGECLSWGCSDPFVAWYDEEKANYNKARNYFLKKYGKDINDPVESDELDNLLGDKYFEIIKQYGQTGHYGLVMAGLIEIDYYYETTYKMAERCIFGLGFNSNPPKTFCLNPDVSDVYSDSYSASAYKSLFMEYYNMVNPKAERAAYDAALSKYNAAISKTKTKLNKVRITAKPTLKKAARKGKTVTAKWAKKSGAAKYEISVTSKRSGTKVVKTVKRTSTKIKIKTAKRKYVKVRSVVKVNGKNVYSKWSAVKRTK